MIAFGVHARVIEGTPGFTITWIETVVLPPGPVATMVYVVVTVGETWIIEVPGQFAPETPAIVVPLAQTIVSIVDPPALMVTGAGVVEPLTVSVGRGRGFTVTEAVADLVGSATEVAVTVTARGDPTTVGAV